MNFFAKLSVMIFMLLSTLVNAQEDLPAAPDDTAAAPIDNYLIVLAIAGIALVFIRFLAFKSKKVSL